MRNRARHHNRQIDDLRLAIDCLPAATREAMLEGLHAHRRIIVGAYVDQQGGVCPMLAAHRCGGRTDFLSFAKSWDRFTRAAGRARPATPRELDVLVRLLRDSVSREAGLDLAGAIEQHKGLRERSERERQSRLRAFDANGEIRVRRLRRGTVRRLLTEVRRPVLSDVVARAHEHHLGHDAGG